MPSTRGIRSLAIAVTECNQHRDVVLKKEGFCSPQTANKAARGTKTAVKKLQMRRAAVDEDAEPGDEEEIEEASSLFSFVGRLSHPLPTLVMKSHCRSHRRLKRLLLYLRLNCREEFLSIPYSN